VARKPYRMAAIDVGTNSIHMIVVEAQRRGYRVIDKEKEMIQLGRDSLEGRPLTNEAIERGVATLKTMADIARRWKVSEILAVATSAIREAPNRRRFIAAVEKNAGIRVRVISGEEEADYIYRAVRSAVDFHGGTALSIDIGGGSVEFIVGTATEVFLTRSEPVGALRLAQKFPDIDDCRRHVRKALRKTLTRIKDLGFDFTIGTSGTILTLATLGSEGVTSGLRWLTRARVQELIETLAPLDPAGRAKLFPALDERRAETIVAGAIVLEQIMKRLDIEQIRACDAALREGIVEYVLDRLSEGSSDGAADSVRQSAVLALAERSSVDMSHAAQVARLALRIFDQTEDLHLLRTGERELLESAAILHEVGMHVSYQSHHKHSYYLISHAALRGYTGDQVSVIANVARYYRKAVPSDEHAGFAELSPNQRSVVEKLTAILRIADALDRGRRGAIRDVSVKNGKDVVRFRLRQRTAAGVEVEAAKRRAKYFGKVFGRKVAFEMAAR
jgi:exopolyphosphatase / guanosine-5'-triphosphate,3'-diphosphate pyrophosphatase